MSWRHWLSCSLSEHGRSTRTDTYACHAAYSIGLRQLGYHRLRVFLASGGWKDSTAMIPSKSTAVSVLWSSMT
eukprot:1567858-Rhodomonas_salina.1